MFDRLISREINAELLAATLFMIVSGSYITWKYGTGKIIDTLLLWMFPASVMIFLTLLLVKFIERTHERRVSKHKYVDWSRK
ncbi:MAG TPA: hypothetical protein VJH92_05295 [Candidatus Nanoarchaeia archaeon]|nr:hypothetical protein [Candidatus Nanoarchaeia archaeon]